MQVEGRGGDVPARAGPPRLQGDVGRQLPAAPGEDAGLGPGPGHAQMGPAPPTRRRRRRLRPPRQKRRLRFRLRFRRRPDSVEQGLPSLPSCFFLIDLYLVFLRFRFWGSNQTLFFNQRL